MFFKLAEKKILITASFNDVSIKRNKKVNNLHGNCLSIKVIIISW